MDNRGMMTSLLAIGAASAAVYGIKKGVENGTFQRIPKNVSNAMSNVMNNETVQQIAEPLQTMLGKSSKDQPFTTVTKVKTGTGMQLQ